MNGPTLLAERAPFSTIFGPDRLSRRVTAGFVAGYWLLAVVVYWAIWSKDPRSVTQLGGDQFGTVWFLQWVPFAVAHGHNPLFTTFANYPHGVNLLDNTSVPLLGLLGAPITWAWGAIATYNFWCTAALAGSAWAAFVLARRIVNWRPAAFVAGLLYGFSPYEIAQSGHLNLSFMALPPLILLCVYELAVGERGSPRRWGVLLGLLLVAQFFISTEVLASTVVLAGVCIAAAAVLRRRSLRTRLRELITGFVWAVGITAVLLAYPAWLVLRGPASIRGPIQLEPQAYRADLLGTVIPGLHQWLAPSAMLGSTSTFASSTSENGSYLGITLLASLLVGSVILWRRSDLAKIVVIGGSTALVLSLGAGLVVTGRPSAATTGLPLPERLFAHLPLLSNTVPVRYSTYVGLFAALLLAMTLDRLHQALLDRRRSRATRKAPTMFAWGAPCGLAALCLVPLLPALPVSPIGPTGTPSYFRSPAVRRIPSGSVAVLYPYPTAILPSAVLWQAEASMRFKMPGGYFLVPSGSAHRIAYTPTLLYGANTLTARTLHQMFANGPPLKTATLRRALRDQLGAWHVDSIVASLVGVPDPGASLEFLIWLTGRLPTPTVGGVYAWYGLLRTSWS